MKMFLVDGKEILNKSDDEEDLIFDHTSLLNKDTRMRNFSNGCCPTGGKLQIARTVNLCLSFFGLGLCFAIPTATLGDLQKAVQADDNIKNIYTARYSGYLFGALIGGFLFDRYNRQFLLFLSLLATGIGILVMPFCQELAALMACTAVTGITMGFLDTGGNVWCLDLWGRKSAPIMQTLHFCFGLGAFMAPIVAEPFLSPQLYRPPLINMGNDSLVNSSILYSHPSPRLGLPHTSLQGNKHIIVKHSVDSFYNFDQIDDETMLARFKRDTNETEWDSSSLENITTISESNLTTTSPSNMSSQIPTVFRMNSTTTTVKPKPRFADGNQLKQKDKWDLKPRKDRNGNLVIPDVSKVNVIVTTVKPSVTTISIKPAISTNVTVDGLAKNKSTNESDLDTNESLSSEESTENSTGNFPVNGTGFENGTTSVDWISPEESSNSSFFTETNVTRSEFTTKISPLFLALPVPSSNSNITETKPTATSIEPSKSTSTTLISTPSSTTMKQSNTFDSTDGLSSITNSLKLISEETKDFASTTHQSPLSSITPSSSTTEPNIVLNTEIVETTSSVILAKEATTEASNEKKSFFSTEQVEEIIEHPNDSRKLLNEISTDGFVSTPPSLENPKNINMPKESDEKLNNDPSSVIKDDEKSPKYFPQETKISDGNNIKNFENMRMSSAHSAPLIKTTVETETSSHKNNLLKNIPLESEPSDSRLAPPSLNNAKNLSSEEPSTESSSTVKPMNDIFNYVFDLLHKNRLSRFEIPYILLAVYIFVVASVFLVFLCKNPREPRSRQLEELSRSRDVSLSFQVVMVGLMSLFLCLYVGIEVGVGELLETFATKETLQLSQARGYFLPYLFWGSFVAARGVSIFIATRVTGRCMLLTNLTVCLIASVMLVAGADKLEALLWIGIVVLGAGMAPLFPTSISWLEHYLHITNKTASIFVLGAAIGELIIPIVIDTFINQEPMVLMYVNIIVNALCFISFIILCVMASKHSEKYQNKPKRSMYQLASSDDYEDVTELVPNADHTNGYHLPIKRKLPPVT